ncbi:MAG: CbtB-domain containing protein [Propionibacteriaceae bacterium]|nr:MAG: CbtB-domain containing protein [Propionibacteriaceae bacterium]
MTDHRSAPYAAAVAAPAPAALPLQPLPLRAVLPWLVLAALLALVTMYFVGAEQGATSLLNGTAVHEWTHDGRHLLGFPCH